MRKLASVHLCAMPIAMVEKVREKRSEGVRARLGELKKVRERERAPERKKMKVEIPRALVNSGEFMAVSGSANSISLARSLSLSRVYSAFPRMALSRSAPRGSPAFNYPRARKNRNSGVALRREGKMMRCDGDSIEGERGGCCLCDI